MKKVLFTQNWIFTNCATGESKPVNLPHDAMIEEKRDPNCLNGKNTGYYPGGKYVYTQTLFADSNFANKAVILELEGVQQNAAVSLNGKVLCKQPYGYTAFFVDLTDLLQIGEENIVEVVADNSGEPCSRWYTGSGIYRPVYLHIGERNCILPDSICVQTVSYNPAVIRVISDYDDVRFEIYDGKENVAQGCGRDVKITIPNARLWSAENPNLYTLKAFRYINDVKTDETELSVGICKIEYSANGLLINGKQTKLRGACIHHDNGILGAEEYTEAAVRRIAILKEAGFNAIRSAHNPVSRAILNACDKLGMYVMDEFADMWYEHKTRYDYACHFEQWFERDLSAMVQKDYSHPSVIMYSIGNEVTETKDEWGIELTKQMTELVHNLDNSRPVTCGINMALNTMHFAGMGVYAPADDEPPRRNQAKNPKALALLAEQMKAAQADPERAKQMQQRAQGLNQSQTDNGVKLDGKLVGSEYFNAMMVQMKERQRLVVTQPIAKVLSEDAFAALDIAGYNYADGRYYLDKEEYPTRISVGTETLPHRISNNWKAVCDCPYVLGDFMWTGWDYIGEAGVGSFCYDSVGTKDKEYPALLAGTGVIDICGHMRPEVWLNKCVFGLDNGPYIGVEPVTHSGENHLISAWRYSDAVHSWSWFGCEGLTADIIVYANAAYVELYLNGELIDKKTIENYQAKFTTVYQAGRLEAVAYDVDGKVIGRDVLQTADNDTVITVKVSKRVLSADGQDLSYLDICLADKNGIVKCSQDQDITVTVDGAATLAGFGSADPFNTQSYTGNTHKTYYGRVQAVVRSGYSEGSATVTVSSKDCKTVTVNLKVE